METDTMDPHPLNFQGAKVVIIIGIAIPFYSFLGFKSLADLRRIVIIVKGMPKNTRLRRGTFGMAVTNRYKAPGGL